MPKKILIIEDHIDTLDMLEILLTREGFFVTTATDGEEGLERASRDFPDLILTDLHMPHLNGVEMVKRLRQMPEFSNIPIVAMTADRDLQAAAIQAGVDHFVKKPVAFDKLSRILEQLL